MEFDNIETIKRAIEIDAGIGLLPEPTVVREVAAGTLAAVSLSTDTFVRPLGIIHRRGKDLGVTVRRFIELLRSEGAVKPIEQPENITGPHEIGVGGSSHDFDVEPRVFAHANGNGHRNVARDKSTKLVGQAANG